jgi:putative Flp pilus-assembly TadE/G-like protein
MTRKDEAGQALVFAVVALGLLLLGFAGLGIDMGYLRYVKRLQQTAADAAAISGASNLCPSVASCLPYGGVTLGAQNAAAANGYTDNTGGLVSTCTSTNVNSSALVGDVCVQVNNPPAAGPHSGDPNYVEVLVSTVQPTFFMGVLGIFSEAVTARAVATNAGAAAGSGCLYMLGTPPNSTEGVGTLDAPGCGIVDNGNFNLVGNPLNVTAGTFGLAGTSGPGGTMTCSGSSTCPVPNMPTSGDPIAPLVTPPTVGLPVAFNPASIVPGSTYSSISLTDGSVTTFPAGLYILDGGFSITGNATVFGTGVTFYFTNGGTISTTPDASGSPNIQLSAPNSGAYTGILFYQDPSDTSPPLLGGNSSSFYQGALYFPSALLTFSGAGTFNSGALYTFVVANSLALSGGPVVVINSNYALAGLPNGASIIRNASLVE